MIARQGNLEMKKLLAKKLATSLNKGLAARMILEKEIAV